MRPQVSFLQDTLRGAFQTFLQKKIETLADEHPELPKKERLQMARAALESYLDPDS